MNKEDFLKKLESKLKVLDEKEIKDIIEEYSNHIDNAIKDGKTEEEAIKDFGNINDLAKEILSAYKIRKDYNGVVSDIEDGINGFVNKGSDFVKKTLDSAGSEKNIVTFIFEILIIFILIWILKLPFYIIKALGLSLLSFFSSPLYEISSFIWKIVVDFGYFISAILIIMVAVKNRFGYIEINKEPKSEKKKDELKKEKKTEQKTKVESRTKEKSWLYSAIEIVFKIFVLFLLIPAIFSVMGLTIFLGVLIFLMFKGIFLFGFIILTVGLMITIGAFIDIFMKFIKGGNN